MTLLEDINKKSYFMLKSCAKLVNFLLALDNFDIFSQIFVTLNVYQVNHQIL